MARRALGRKGGCYSLTKSLTVTSRDSIASASKCRFDDSSAKALSASVIHLLGHHFPLAFRCEDDDLPLFASKCSIRYTVAVGGIGVIYTLFQIPLAIYNVAKEKRLIRNGLLQEFDFYGDKVIAFLLATGVGLVSAYRASLKEFLPSATKERNS